MTAHADILPPNAPLIRRYERTAGRVRTADRGGARHRTARFSLHHHTGKKAAVGSRFQDGATTTLTAIARRRPTPSQRRVPRRLCTTQCRTDAKGHSKQKKGRGRPTIRATQLRRGFTGLDRARRTSDGCDDLRSSRCRCPIPEPGSRPRPSRASVIARMSRSSQRSVACPFATTAASGWFTSCAIDAISSPSVATRAAWARSACARASSRSLATRELMSSSPTTTGTRSVPCLG